MGCLFLLYFQIRNVKTLFFLILFPNAFLAQSIETLQHEYIQLLRLDKTKSDSIISQQKVIIDLLQIVVEGNAQSRQLDSTKNSLTNIKMNMFKGLSEIHEKNEKLCQLRCDSIMNLSENQKMEIEFLSEELFKSIKHQISQPVTERKVIKHLSTNIIVQEELTVHMRLLVNETGNVVLVKILNPNSIKDKKLVETLIDDVKNTLLYDSKVNRPLVEVFYTVKILPN